MNNVILGKLKMSGIVVALAVAVLVLGCGSSDDSPSVESIDSILAGSIEIAGLTSVSAAVQAETTVDVVCSVVYGTDDSYGNQSTDLDMAGTGHSTHAAPLRGLEPDTTYFYRLQGAGPDGTIYVSDQMTFTTPPAEASSAGGRTNLAGLAAGAAIVEVSSEFNDTPAWQAENAIDEDASTEWSSAGDGDDAYITIELAERSQLESIGLWTRTMGSSAEIASFRVLTEDGSILGPFELSGTPGLQEFPVEATAQQLRFEVVSSSGGNTGIVEIAVFGAE